MIKFKEGKEVVLVTIDEETLDELKRLAEIGLQAEMAWERIINQYIKKGERMKKKTKTVKKVKKTKTKTNKS